MPDAERRPPEVVSVTFGDGTLPVKVTITTIVPWSWPCPNCGERVYAPEEEVGEIACAACGAWWTIHTVRPFNAGE